MPNAPWPNLPDYRNFSEADHAAHRSPRGVAYPENLGMTRKASKTLLKGSKVGQPKLQRNRSPKRKKRT